MYTRADKSEKNEIRSKNRASQKLDAAEPTSQFVDNRPETIAQRALQERFDHNSHNEQAAQLKTILENYTDFHQPIQKRANHTGLPNNLKTGIENLSGYAMDDVRVHYNSNKPAQLNAHAYAQGTTIHLGPGQEKHLPHEAWHVVQQKQGRVKPTTQLKSKVDINDDPTLEKEADVMGAKALQMRAKTSGKPVDASNAKDQERHPLVFKRSSNTPLQLKLRKNRFNVAGETHEISNGRRASEQAFTEHASGSPDYWQEKEFRMERLDGSYALGDRAYLRAATMLQVAFNYNDDYFYNLNVLFEVAEGTNTESDFDELQTILGQMDEKRNEFFGYTIAELRREEDLEANDDWRAIKELLQSIQADYDGLMMVYASENAEELRPHVVTLREAGRAFNEKIKPAFETYGIREQDGSDQSISRDRETQMNTNANLAQETGYRGVWKIGDDHVAGILGLGAAITYNLVSEEEFESEYIAFVSRPLRILYPNYEEAITQDTAGARALRDLGDVRIPPDTPQEQMAYVAMAIKAKQAAGD